MSWFDDLVDSAPAGSLGFPAMGEQRVGETCEPEVHTIGGGAYDDYLFEQSLLGVESLQEVVDKGLESYQLTRDLAADVLRSLYQIEPREQEVEASHSQNAAAIHEMLSTSEWKDLHDLTQLDAFASAISTGHMTQALIETLQKTPENLPVPQQQDDEGEAQKQPSPAIQKAQRQLRSAARQAAQKAQEAVQEAQDAMDAFSGGEDEVGPGWGLDGGHSHMDGDIQQRAALAKKIMQNDLLKRISQLAGRIKKVAAHCRRKRLAEGNQEIYGVTLGNSIQDVLPREIALFAHPALKNLFLVKYATKSLVQLEKRTPEPVGRGPIICAVDESGSTVGDVIAWEKAVQLALHSIAAKQKRDLRIIHFGSPRQILVEDFPQGKGTPEQVMQSALHFFGGGTWYEEWMQSSLEAIEGSAYEKADVVLLTDGLCGVGDEMLAKWNTARREKKFRCVSILVHIPSGKDLLAQFSDEVVLLSNLSNDQAALETVFTLTI